MVLTWQGPSWQIERIGQGWRSGPDLGLDSAQLAARIEAWQGWLLPPGEAVRGTPVTLKIWIAGQSDPGWRWGSIRMMASLPPCCLPLDLAQPEQAQYRDLMRPTPEPCSEREARLCPNYRKSKSVARDLTLAHRHQGPGVVVQGRPVALAGARRNPGAGGSVIHRVRRRAKYLLLETDFGTAILHLGMSGSLRCWTSAPRREARSRGHQAGQRQAAAAQRSAPLRCPAVDPRTGRGHALLAKAGPRAAHRRLQRRLPAGAPGRSTAIKQFLMDNHVVVGVGNIYANEALYAAGIHPKRAAGNISAERLGTLVSEIKRVLAEAIRQGHHPQGLHQRRRQSGYFVQQLQVYGRAANPVSTATPLLTEVRMGQRTTVFCFPLPALKGRLLSRDRPSCKRALPVCLKPRQPMTTISPVQAAR